MYSFYLVVFFTGVLYTLVSLIISGISGGFHSGTDTGGADGHFAQHGHDSGHVHAGLDNADAVHPGHVHVGHPGGDVQGNHTQQGDSGGHGIFSWLTILINPLVAVSFLTVFGGLGIMGTKITAWDSIIVFFGALAAGIAVAALLYNFVAKPIYRSENSSDVSREKLVGTPAEVTTDILENGYGTIKYTVNSIRYTAPAKHIDERAVKQGQKVVICRIENNTFYVSELSEILNT
ncbi:hypothetical protein CLHUN_38550 [Ruminiclostridium hungatei]|uniref:Membrane protein NfeD2 N-terminal transmembrane domain-containing protein n=1 Tax=Ruminiclostridium hungatei TaxID=48256 RepID=A0A1V4SFG3_RUMHU|nr:NfeD family protein [Ruminiclostridium hungatei]OPX42205.1 hypothetical protein CLHUN_38550 [Ruminiclostridium hungatei]